MPRRPKRARVDVIELDQSAQTSSSSSSDEEAELVIDDALLAQDAPFELRCWSEAVSGATAPHLHELCAEAFMAFQGRSFWVPADRSPPPPVSDDGWALLERFAADVYVRDFLLRSCSCYPVAVALPYTLCSLVSRRFIPRGLLTLI